MTIEELALLEIEACEAEGIAHLITGAFATSLHGIPRSTKDVDLVLELKNLRFIILTSLLAAGYSIHPEV